MQTAPRRLVPGRVAVGDIGAPMGWVRTAPAGGRFYPKLRAGGRTVATIVWILAAVPVQALCLCLPGSLKVRFARWFWAVFCRLFGVERRVVGALAGDGARPVVFVCNHTSWLDIPVLGGTLPACFVSKADVRSWPLINIVAWLGRTVFVRRQRASTGRERDAMRARLAAGDSLILFAEGTTSDGSRVLPFLSSLLAVAEGAGPPLLQPVSLVYDRLAGLPAGRLARPLFAYYGDMTLGPHFWALAQRRGLRATVLLHPPVDPGDHADRKALSRDLRAIVAGGAATLRQNREVAGHLS